MARVTVKLDEDHLAQLIRSPRVGIVELIWNALDADATEVNVTFELTELGAIDSVAIADNGHGLRADEVEREFGALGGSWKKFVAGTRGLGRDLHGTRGRGRFAAFGVGGHVVWSSVAETDEGNKHVEISAWSRNLSSFEVSDPLPTSNQTGTVVTISDIPESAAKALEKSTISDDLTAEFAFYLESYSGITITWCGETLDPASMQMQQNTYVIDTPDGLESASLEVIEWARPVERVLHLCSEAGMSLALTKPGIHAPGFEFTAYVRWSGFNKHDVLLADLGVEPAATVIDQAKEKLRSHFRERASERERLIVKDWVDRGVYPYEGDADVGSAVKTAERQMFDVVAVTAAQAVNSGELPAQKLSLRLLREALESNPANLHQVLQGVLELPQDRLDELSRLLNRTTLTSIISTAKKIENRLRFLSGLDSILFDAEPRAQTLERRQLHRILANETWVFGEEYALTGDDEPLTKVLRKHLSLLGDDVDIADDKPVLRHDGSTPIPDLVLSRTSEVAQDLVENLIVELKRPSVRLTSKELTQIEEYALAVMRDERFNKPNVKWDFWLIGNSLDEFVESRRNQVGFPFGYVQMTERKSVQVRTWSEVINGARHRLKFVERNLDYRADHADGVEYLRETHARYLPKSLAEGESTSEAATRGKSSG